MEFHSKTPMKGAYFSAREGEFMSESPGGSFKPRLCATKTGSDGVLTPIE